MGLGVIVEGRPGDSLGYNPENPPIRLAVQMERCGDALEQAGLYELSGLTVGYTDRDMKHEPKRVTIECGICGWGFETDTSHLPTETIENLWGVSIEVYSHSDWRCMGCFSMLTVNVYED